MAKKTFSITLPLEIIELIQKHKERWGNTHTSQSHYILRAVEEYEKKLAASPQSPGKSGTEN